MTTTRPVSARTQRKAVGWTRSPLVLTFAVPDIRTSELPEDRTYAVSDILLFRNTGATTGLPMSVAKSGTS